MISNCSLKIYQVLMFFPSSSHSKLTVNLSLELNIFHLFKRHAPKEIDNEEEIFLILINVVMEE